MITIPEGRVSAEVLGCRVSASPCLARRCRIIDCYVPICDVELLFEYFSVFSILFPGLPFLSLGRPLVFLFYFNFRRWRADWSSRLSIIRDELIGCEDVRAECSSIALAD